MRAYETVFVLNPELGADAQAEQVEFYKDLITKNGGSITNIDAWGKINMAYKIDRFSEGIYTVVQFQGTGALVEELERRYKYNEDVLRYIVVQLDEKKFKAKPRKDPVRRERKPRRDNPTDEQSDIPAEMLGDDEDNED
ncbi:MAG: 30S ribosomal protein S6 [Deferribacteraceae bacterium]|nr:30S ribosomal protein S6 [Deferribacteraceae bacterium]